MDTSDLPDAIYAFGRVKNVSFSGWDILLPIWM